MRCWAFRVAVLFGSSLSVLSLRADEMEPHLLDCGPNSLFILLKLTGHEADLNAITRSLPPRDSAGYSLSELQTAASKFGLRLNGVRFDKRNSPLSQPAIAYIMTLGEGHFIILKPVGVTGKMVQIIDPPSAPVITDYDQLLAARSWTGRLLIPRSKTDYLLSWLWTALPFIFFLLSVNVLRRIKLRKAIRKFFARPEFSGGGAIPSGGSGRN